MKRILLLLMIAGTLLAGTVDLGLSVNDEHYYIGDRIKFGIEIKGSERQMYVLPDVREWIKDVMILDIKTDQEIRKDIKKITIRVEAVGLDTGFVHIPPMPVVSTDSTGFGQPDTFYTPEKYIYIYSILDSASAPIAMTPPVPLSIMTWWEFLIALLLLSVSVLLLIVGIKHRSKKKEIDNTYWETPREKAEHYLEDLRGKNYPDKKQWKTFYLELTDIARDYFENIYFVHLKELTTTDLLPALNEHADEKYRDKLKEFFRFADLVKFAKGVASREQCDAHFDLVKEIVESEKEEEEVNGSGPLDQPS